MWQRKRLLYLLLAGSGAMLLAVSCADYLTGQLEEPSGPLQITRLTLFDATSHNGAVFTDTSIPDCSKNKDLDCTSPDNRDSLVCRVCYNDVAKDRFSPARSMPTPDSGQDIRVVFNKVPLLLDGDDLGKPENLIRAVELSCTGCSGLPPLKRVLQITGSGITFDPLQVPYGPSLQLAVDRTDPRSALEPGASYQVKVNAGLAGRDGQKVDLQVPATLLAFQTEPFKVLQIGTGDPKADAWVYNSTELGDGSAQMPYKIGFPPNVADGGTGVDLGDDKAIGQNSAAVLRWNAPLYTEAFKPVIIKALINTGTATVDVRLGANNCKLASDKYVQDGARMLYLYPDTVDHNWPFIANQITLVIPGGVIKDVAQTAGFPAGQHGPSADVHVTIKLSGKLAEASFAGVSTTAALAATNCMPVTMGSPDLSGGPMDLGGDLGVDLGPPGDL